MAMKKKCSSGHYVPQLATKILEGNKKAHHKKDRINLKGIMIGNAAIDASSDDRGLADYAWDHAIISDELYGSIKKECTFPEDGQESGPCNQAWNEFFGSMRNIDIYSLYTPACTDTLANASRSNSWKLAGTPLAVRRRRRRLSIHRASLTCSPLPCVLHEDDYSWQHFCRGSTMGGRTTRTTRAPTTTWWTT